MSTSHARSPRILILVQNLPVPFDRRVWLECRTLVAGGFRVAVVCPKGPGDSSFEVLDGVELYKYRPYFATAGRAAFVVEYLYSFAATLILGLSASRRGRFDVVQSCNPPDTFWLIGRLFKRLFGSHFIFDHHDLCPELYRSRFNSAQGVVYRALCWLERMSIRSADHVIATNDSYRAVEVERDGASSERVTVVRTGPDLGRLVPVPPDPTLRRGRAHLVAYLGVMGPQDGVDLLVRVADVVVHDLGRDDVSFTVMGSGDCMPQLERLRRELGVEDVIEFTGRVSDEIVAGVLSTADLGVCPDPKNPLNDVSTMNKTMEYMAFGLPVLAFDLRETRVSAGEGGVYARCNDVQDMACLLVGLLDDEDARRRIGAAGRRRVVDTLAWSHQAGRYLEVYQNLTRRPVLQEAS